MVGGDGALVLHNERCTESRLPGSARRRREPERSVLQSVICDHLETFLAEARGRSDDGAGLPAFVEDEFRHYLACGVLANGFARVRCGGCGHDFLVAFSCCPQQETICTSGSERGGSPRE